MATPCDGIRECRDGRDEECKDDKLILIFVISVLVATTLIIHQYLLWIKIPRWRKSVLRDFKADFVDERNPTNYIDFRGNDLANLKVSYIKICI